MDPIGIISVIGSTLVGLGGVAVAWRNGRQPLLVEREKRRQERLADSYLEVLQIAEREGQWLETTTANLRLDREEIHNGLVRPVRVPETEVRDRARVAALLAAFGSTEVRTSYAACRSAADVAKSTIDDIKFWGNEVAEPVENVPDDMLKPLEDNELPAEQTARKVLSDAVAKELGHR
jgi:hypothetical protein